MARWARWVPPRPWRLACALAWLSGAAWAQPAVPAGLAPGQVVRVDGYVFARASGPLRDPSVPLQSLLASRASAQAARWLCQYTASPATRLDATLARVSVVEVRQEGDQLAVTIRLPMQTPECMVRAALPSEPASGLGSPAGVAGASGLQPSSAITVRQYEVD